MSRKKCFCYDYLFVTGDNPLTVRIWRIRGHVFMVGYYLCYQALTVFVIFCLDGRVFMLFRDMHSTNVVSSLFGCFRF